MPTPQSIPPPPAKGKSAFPVSLVLQLFRRDSSHLDCRSRPAVFHISLKSTRRSSSLPSEIRSECGLFPLRKGMPFQPKPYQLKRGWLSMKCGREGVEVKITVPVHLYSFQISTRLGSIVIRSLWTSLWGSGANILSFLLCSADHCGSDITGAFTDSGNSETLSALPER